MKRVAMLLLRRWAMVLAYWVAAVLLFTSLPLWAVALALVSTLSHGRWRALRAMWVLVVYVWTTPLLTTGHQGMVLLCLSLGLGRMGLSYGPLGAALGSLVPTAVRYTGASLTFNLAGIVGASLTPYAATWLAGNFGLQAVGWYLSAAGMVTLVALLLLSRSQMAARH